MAFLYVAGFDYHGASAADFQRYDSVGNMSWSASDGKFGGGSLSIDPGTSNLRHTLISSASESGSGWVSCYWTRRLDSGVNSEFLEVFGPSALHFWIEIGNSQRKGGVTSDNKLILLNRDDTLLGESINTFGGNQTSTIIRHLEMSWTLGQGDGTCKIWVNDVLEINETGLTIGSVADLDDWRKWGSDGPQGFLSTNDSVRLDDLVWQDGNGIQLFDGHRIRSAVPSSDTTKNWTRSAGADNYALVDDTDPDQDTTYIESVAGRDVYAFTAPTFTGTNHALIVKALGRRPSGSETFKLGIKVGSDELLSDAFTPPSTTLWKEFQAIFPVAPLGNIWTQADLDAAEIIIEGTGTNIRVTQVWIELLSTTLVIPDRPTITAVPTQTTAALTSSAFGAGEGGAHAASQWQTTLSTDGGFAAVIDDSGTDAVNLVTYTATGLTTGIDYISRVRHQEDNDLWSDWSSSLAFTTTTGPVAPTLVITESTPDSIHLTGDAFVPGTSGSPHGSTRWQLTLSTDTLFATPILDTTTSVASQLLDYTEFNLNLFTNQYIARVIYIAVDLEVGEWSNTVTSGLATTGQYYTPFGERALGFQLRSANWDEAWAALESTWTNTADLEAICLVVSRRIPNTPTPGEVDPIFWQNMPQVDKQIIWTRIKFDQVGFGADPCVGDSSPGGYICRITEGLENFEDFEDPALPGWRVVRSGALGKWSHVLGRGASLAGDEDEDPTSNALAFYHKGGDPLGPNAYIVWDAAGNIAVNKWMQTRLKLTDMSSPGWWWRTGWGGTAMGGQNDEQHYSFQNAHRCDIFSTWVFQTTYKHGPLSTNFTPQAMFRVEATPIGSTLSYHVGNNRYQYMKSALIDGTVPLNQVNFGAAEVSYTAFGNRRGFDSMGRTSFENSWKSGKVGLVYNACISNPTAPVLGSTTLLFDHVAITTNNFVTFTGLPEGWTVKITANSIGPPFWFGADQVPRRWPVGNAAVDPQTINFEGHAMPYDTLLLYDADDNLIDTWNVGDNALGEPGIWGGDVYNISVGGGGIGAIGGPAARVVGTSGGIPATDKLLLESGDYLLLESGDKLELE